MSKTTHKSQKRKSGRNRWKAKVKEDSSDDEDQEEEMELFDFQLTAADDDDDNIEDIQLPEDTVTDVDEGYAEGLASNIDNMDINQ